MATNDEETDQESIKSENSKSGESVENKKKTLPFIKPSAMQQVSEELKEALKLPPIPAGTMTLEKAQAWLNSLTNEVKPRIVLYFYRLYPVIKRELDDPSNDSNIDKMYAWVDDMPNEDMGNLRAYIIKKHGGGRYKIIISDVERKKTNRTGISEIRVSIPVQESEPILNIREVDVFHSENRSYIFNLKSKGLIDKDGNVLDLNKPTGSNNTIDPIAVMKETVGIMKSVQNMQPQQDKHEQAMQSGLSQVLIELTKQNDPNKIMTMLQTMMNTVKGSIPPPSTDTSSNTMTAMLPLLLKMMEMSQESSERQTTLMLKMMEINKPLVNPTPVQSTDPVDQFTKMLTAMQMLDEYKSGKSITDKDEEPKTGWDKVLDVVEKVAPAILPGLLGGGLRLPQQQQNMGQTNQHMMPPGMGQGLAMIPNNNNTLTQGQITAPDGATIYDPYSMGPNGPTAPIDQLNVPTDQALNPSIVNGQQNSTPPTIEQQLGQIINMYGGMLAQSMLGGQKGYELAYSVINIPGMNAFAAIQQIKQIPMDKIIKVMKDIPPFWGLVSGLGEGFVKEWVEQFVNYEKYNDEEEDTNEGVM